MDFLASLINIDPGIRIEIRFVDQSAQLTVAEMRGWRYTACF